MNENISEQALQYDDLPRTNFPVGEDNWRLMQDPSISLLPLIKQYNSYYSSGNYVLANKIITDNPDLLDCFFNADKWNCIRDAVLALERYYLEDVKEFIYNVSQNSLGINDTPTAEQLKTTAYSTGKINALLNEMNKVRTVLLSAAGWSASAPYTQTVNVAGITASDNPVVSLYLPEGIISADVKLQSKAYGCVDKGVTGAGTITFRCYNKKPTVDFPVAVKGV